VTTQDRYRLADSTVLEPLVNKWHAWSQLMSPLTAGFHLLNYQCNTMKSYIDDPESHVRACSDAALKGGPFVNIPIDRVEDIRSLLDDTLSRQGSNIELAKAVVSYYNKLVNEAVGQSIEPYYEYLPPELKGYVELVYDYYGRPTLRILEGMLYESPYYNESLQSLRLFRLEADECRDFFMSTPRLFEEGEINCATPFAADGVDSLFRLEREFRPLGYIKELLGLQSVSETTFRKLFTKDAVRPKEPLDRSLLRLRYFGHATVLMEWNGISILTDPYVSVTPQWAGIERYSYNDLPDRIDFALVTHNHHDHLVLETLLRLRNRIACLVVPKSNGLLYGDTSLKLMARKLGIRNCLEFDTLDSVDFPGGEIIGVPFLGEHSDIAHSKIGYVVRAGSEQVLFAADSACLDESIYRNVRKLIGPIQTVFLGMECVGAPLTWHCGSLLPKTPDYNHDQSRRSHGCDAAGGLRVLEILEARRFYNYAMGLEPWLEFLLGLGLSEGSTQIKESNKLLGKARGRGFLAAERLFAKRDIYLPNNEKATGRHKPLGEHGQDKGVRDGQACIKPTLWFLSASEPEALFSNSSAMVQIKGKLDEVAIERALSKVVARHEVLATTVSNLNGAFTYNASTPCPIKLKVMDLTALDAEDMASASYSSLLDEQGRPFNPETGPLLRACLINLPAENHYIVLTGQRLVCDSWTLSHLIEEMAKVYAEMVTNRADLQTERQMANRARNGSPPDDGVRVSEPIICRNSDDRKRFANPVLVAGPLLDSITRLGADVGCDAWVILLAAFKVMIHAIEHNEDVDVRAIVEDPDSQQATTSFASVLRLMTNVSGDLSFSLFSKRLREVATRAMETQKVTCDNDVEKLRKEFDSDCHASLHPVFIFKRRFRAELRLPGSEWSYVDEVLPWTESSLMLWLHRDASGISGVLCYDESVLNFGLSGDLADKYKSILQEVALNPDKQVYELNSVVKASDHGPGVKGLNLDQQFDFSS
jgi:L-ascorbate metabolism protein UlaG (beta-lactamase superfamily)